VICAVLRKEGIVFVDGITAAAIEVGELLPSGSRREVGLRAAAMCAVEAAFTAVAEAAEPVDQEANAAADAAVSEEQPAAVPLATEEATAVTRETPAASSVRLISV